MVKVKITRNYQLTVPAEVRDALNIREGDVVEVLVEGDGAVIVTLKRKKITFRVGQTFTVEELEQEVEKARGESVG